MTGHLRVVSLVALTLGGPSMLAAAEPRFALLAAHPSDQPPPVRLVVDVGGIIHSALRGDVPGIVYHALSGPYCADRWGYHDPWHRQGWGYPYPGYPDYGYGQPYGYDYRAYYAPGVAGAPPPNPPALPERARIVNSVENRATLSFLIDGQVHSLAPGGQQDVQGGPARVIAFDRGQSHGTARYAIRAGTYTFTPTEKGWELYHSPPSAAEEVPRPEPIPPAHGPSGGKK